MAAARLQARRERLPAGVGWPGRRRPREVEEVHALLREIGATILRAPAEYPYTPGSYAVFFLDPDGVKLEVVCEPAQGGTRSVCPACGAAVSPDSPGCRGCGLSSAPASTSGTPGG